MRLGGDNNRHRIWAVRSGDINLSTNVITPYSSGGSGSIVFLPAYVKPTIKVVFAVSNPSRILGLENRAVYFIQSEVGAPGVFKLFLTLEDLDNDTPFDFTTENTAELASFVLTTVEHKYTTFPCVEKAAIDVEDMFCCPEAPDPNYRPEYITLNTGSGDDSGDYYPNEYPITSGDSAAGNNYKSRNQVYVPITRVQDNIYDGPILHGTYNDTYTLRWEITTEQGDIGSDTPPGPIGPAGYKRNRVKLFVSANFHFNPIYYDYQPYDQKYPTSISIVEIYASPWVLLEDFSYFAAATCTLIGNNDTDYMYPSVPEYYPYPPFGPIYYDTPAGLPIPHTVTLTPSAKHTVFPDSVRLVLKDAKFLTPPSEGDRVFNNQLVGFY